MIVFTLTKVNNRSNYAHFYKREPYINIFLRFPCFFYEYFNRCNINS